MPRPIGMYNKQQICTKYTSLVTSTDDSVDDTSSTISMDNHKNDNFESGRDSSSLTNDSYTLPPFKTPSSKSGMKILYFLLFLSPFFAYNTHEPNYSFMKTCYEFYFPS